MTQFNYHEMSKESGIYIIFNTQNWRKYIGSCKCFQVRWSQHLRALKAGKHSNKFLQADFNKCGESTFEFHVLEHLPNSSREERLKVEEKWLKIHFDGGKNCYNLRKDAISREGFKSSTPEETAAKLSKIHKARFANMSEEERKAATVHLAGPKSVEHKAKIGASNLGRKVSEETKVKMREASANQIRKPFSEETKVKMREVAKGRGLGRQLPGSTKQKISQALLGKKYKPMSLEGKKNISNALKGRKLSKETIAKIVAKHEGKPLSEDHKAKLSVAHKGKVLSEEHRAKLSEAHKNRDKNSYRKGFKLSEEVKLQMSITRTGKPWSEKRRQTYEKKYGISK